MRLTIAEIEQACGGKLVLQKEEDKKTCVTSVVLDSRLVTEQGVFVATVGERVDGHSFISQVFEKGVSLVICEKEKAQVEAETGKNQGEWGTYLVVEHSFEALKRLAEYYRQKLSIPIVGITGSVGKTSTKEFIAGVLAQKYNVLKTEGNYNNEIGVPLTLLKIREAHTAAVVEMGISDFGEMHRLSKMVRPDICVITNIGQCHLENLKTRDGILQAKSEIFDYMNPDGTVVLNGEDDKLSTLTTVLRGSCLENGGKEGTPLFFGFGSNQAECVQATRIKSRGLWGSSATLVVRSADESVRELLAEIPLPGEHMVGNAAAAACVAGVLGLTDEEILMGLSRVRATGGRGKLTRYSQYALIDDCYNANPASMRAAVDLLSLADTERVAILGDMFELGENSESLHREVGSYAAKSDVERLLIVGENAKAMYENAVREAAGRKKIWYFPDRDALLQRLRESREEYLPLGCTILLKASHGMAFDKVLAYLVEVGR